MKSYPIRVMNYLFAKQKNGIFILRVEDTDPERNFDPKAKHIEEDLFWLGLNYDEGPLKDGNFGPYFQSKRNAIYQEKLDYLINHKLAYRCFCTTEELERKRKRQIALKMPPRYDKNCLRLTDQEIQKKLDSNTPFLWRVKLDPESTITINDISHGLTTFDLKNFSDFPINRQNGTFTFMFANFVDDMIMRISHVLRGDDHLSNTAGQVALYKAFNAPIPTFWHLPILCNLEGQKLSKRDFGFSLKDLKKNGFLPEAICNYLAIIGGGSFRNEIMSLDEMSQSLNFEEQNAKGQIKYDVEKLKWINHKWISRYEPEKLATICHEFLKDKYLAAHDMTHEKLTRIVKLLKTDLVCLTDIKSAIDFYFNEPSITQAKILEIFNNQIIEKILKILDKNLSYIHNPNLFVTQIKQDGTNEKIDLKDIFSMVRLGLTGKQKGPGIHDLIDILGTQESKQRIKKLIKNK